MSEARVKRGVPDGNEEPTATVLGIPLTEIVAVVTLTAAAADTRAVGLGATPVTLGFLVEPGFEEPDVEGGVQVVAAGSALALVVQSVICW